jgi:REP element-mobilizing transposase RayT
MTRPLRILIPGGFYHVTCRGNDRRAIYRDDRDRSLFLEKLCGSLATYAVELHAYVLMSNHFHLLVATPKGNLSAFMRHFKLHGRRLTRAIESGGDWQRAWRIGLCDGEPGEEAFGGESAKGQETRRSSEGVGRRLAI